MKANTLALLIAVVSGSLFAIIAPPNMKDKLIGVATFATNERQCFNFHKNEFNDPDSAYVESSYILTKKDALEISKEYMDPAFKKYDALLNVKVRAKNHMNAYVSEYLTCPLVKGSFDDLEARLYKSEAERGPSPEPEPALAPEPAPVVPN